MTCRRMPVAVVLAVVCAVLAVGVAGCGSPSPVVSAPLTYSRPPSTPSATPTPTPTPSPTRTAPATRPSAAEIRQMSLCDALARGRSAMGFLVFPQAQGNACTARVQGAEAVRLCTAIYDDTGQLRVSSTGQTSDPSVVSACPAPTPTATPTPTPTPTPSGTSTAGRAPLGTSERGAWWLPSDGTGDAMLWTFDPLGGSSSSGRRVDYRPAGATTATRTSTAFTYTQSGTTVTLSFASGSQTVTVERYDAVHDVLTVVYQGDEQNWAGCSSGQMPAEAQAACR